MKKLLTFLIIWLASLRVLMIVQAKPQAGSSTFAKYLSQLPAFTGFWQIKLTRSFQGIQTIGYQKEIFDPQQGKYIFEYQFFKPKNLTIPFDTSAKGQILFDQDQITQITILLGEQFLLEGGIETWDKLRLTLNQIGNPNPIFSKLRDLKKFQLNIFLPYILPYMNLKPGKTYSFQTIDLRSINQDQIKAIPVQVIPHSKTFYQLQYSDFTVDLFYNQQGQLISYKTPFFEWLLITDPAKQLEIQQKISATTPQVDEEAKIETKKEAPIKPPAKTAIPKTSTQTKTGEAQTKAEVKTEGEVEAEDKIEIKTGAEVETEIEIETPPLSQTGESRPPESAPDQKPLPDTFANLKNLDLQEQIQKLARKKQKKTCPLVIK